MRPCCRGWRRVRGAGVLAVFAACSGGIDRLSSLPTRAQFEALAAELPYLSVGSILYDRSTARDFRRADRSEHDKHFRILGMVTDGSHAKPELLELLQHDDPRVRTLAAVALFDREDPSLLPALDRLSGDAAATFDSPPLAGSGGAGPPYRVYQQPERQTVRQVARAMISFYLERSGIYDGQFADYWAARRGRSHCAGWFAVQLARASQGSFPTSPDRVALVHAVRRRIDGLPPDDRAWVLLRLAGESGTGELVTDDELLEACRGLGPDKLMLMLQHRIPSDDPDLQPRRQFWPYERMSLFVLRHAEQLLREGDGDTLLALARRRPDSSRRRSAAASVAAARLRPSSAGAILQAAMERFQGTFDSDERLTLAVALAQLAGRSEVGSLADWFYEETPERSRTNANSFSKRSEFVEAMRNEPNGRAIVARILRDHRHADVDWQSLEQLLDVVGSWSDALAPADPATRLPRSRRRQGLVRAVGSGLWRDEPFQDRSRLINRHRHRSQLGAEREYAEETEELRAHLNRSRIRLLASIRHWLDVDLDAELAAACTTTEPTLNPPAGGSWVDDAVCAPTAVP